jgi:repressor LexA
MEKITEAQKKVLDAVRDWFKRHNSPPTLRELCRVTGLNSTWTIRHHLRKLETAGYVKVKGGLSRSIALSGGFSGIPLLGRISAGKPIDAIENVDNNIELKDMFSGIENIFALKVKGDSMTGAGIFDGDIVFVRKQASAVSGEIVAAVLNDEAVVKRLQRAGNTVKLLSENPKYEPITAKEIKVAGKVVGILRKY